jgi:hypothetical protein
MATIFSSEREIVGRTTKVVIKRWRDSRLDILLMLKTARKDSSPPFIVKLQREIPNFGPVSWLVIRS